MMSICNKLALERERVKESDHERSALMEVYRLLFHQHMVHMLDETSHMMMVHRDKYTNALNIMQHAAKGNNMALGFWVNIAKNIRLKMIGHEVGLATDVPRPVITSNVALRMLHVRQEPFAQTPHNELYAVGGVLTIDMFALVDLPVLVRGWYRKKVQPDDEMAVKVEYGPVDPDTGLREKVPLVCVVYLLPDDILLPTAAGNGVQIGRYIPETSRYSCTDISKITMTRGAEARAVLSEAGCSTPDAPHAGEVEPALEDDGDDALVVVSFYTHWLGSFAVVAEVSSNLPYLSWTLGPEYSELDADKWAVLLQVELPWTTVHMRITEQGCALAQPLDGCGAGKRAGSGLTRAMPARQLMLELRNFGLLLSPHHLHAPLVSVARKTQAIEDDLALGVAMVSGGYKVRSALLNKQLGHQSAALLIAPAHIAAPSDHHWTMPAQAPTWAGSVCAHKHLRSVCPHGCATASALCARPCSGESQPISEEAESGGVVQGEEQGGWGEGGLEACFLDGWDTLVLRSCGEEKLEVKDTLRCYCLIAPPSCPPQPPMVTEEETLAAAAAAAVVAAAAAAALPPAKGKGKGKGKELPAPPPVVEDEAAPPAIILSTRERVQVLLLRGSFEGLFYSTFLWGSFKGLFCRTLL